MSKNTLEKFKKDWESQIAKIEKETIDDHGVNLIRLHFEKDKSLLEVHMNEDEFTAEIHLELDTLESKLTIALETARSRYGLQNRRLLAKTIGEIAIILGTIAIILVGIISIMPK